METKEPKMKRIIYKNVDGSVSVIVPSADVLKQHTVTQVAAKDVPAGLAYKIVDSEDIPNDRTFRHAWEIEESELTDGVGNTSNKWE